MTALKKTLDSISELADKVSDLITNINRKINKTEINEDVHDKTNQEFNEIINNGHDTSVSDSIRKKKQQEIEGLK